MSIEKRRNLILLLILGAAVAWFAIQVLGFRPSMRPQVARERQNAEALWSQRPFTRYELIKDISPGDHHCEVVVHEERVEETRTLSGCPSGDHTVSSLFGYIKLNEASIGTCGPNGCACDGAITIKASYDPTFGYPTSIIIRYERGVTDVLPGLFMTACDPIDYVLEINTSVVPLE